MMFSKRAMALFAVLATAAAATAVSTPALRHDVLENRDLADLPDADVDERFQQQAPRVLQEEGTDAPTGAPSPSPSGADGERGFETFSPTAADRDLLTGAPTAADRDLLTEAPVTSGASSLRSTAGIASGLIFVGSVAAAAAMA